MNNKQVRMYCVKLNLVRTYKEKSLGNERNRLKQRKYKFKNNLSNYVKKKLNTEKWTQKCTQLFKEIINKNKYYLQIENDLKRIKSDIHNLYLKNKDLDRNVWSVNIKTKDIIAIGDNNLVRVLKLNLGTFTDKLITIKVGNMDNLIVEKIIKDGLKIDNQHYSFFTAGAGQTRQKKFMMIRDDKTLKDVMLNLMCGLTIEEINKNGGMNISKFLAYLALNNSSSTVWENFDINQCIVVSDFETMVSAKVDYINRKIETIEYRDTLNRKRSKDIANWTINKGEEREIPVSHFDGLGIMLPGISKKNTQIRLPWVKGLLTPFNFVNYIREKNYDTKVTDIYGKEYDVIKDGIQIIFSESQFKLAKYYKDWQQYKDNFNKYNCTANICVQDEEKAEDYTDMQINYQMLQQLINMNDEEVEILCKDFKDLIKKVHSNRNSQLEFLGATNKNKHKNYFQEALRIYPEMLKSNYVKKKLSETITKAKKDVCSGKIKIKNSRRVFILSDPIAFVDWLFGHIKVPEGYLKDGEVYCNLYKDSVKLDVLRSPSLSFEHAIRVNVRTKEKCKWFITNGIYTSTHDIISKILMFDVDGDEALLLNTNWIINLAEEMIKEYNINPIYFEMKKAEATQINNDNIAKSLMFVYDKGNIGKVSNTLTKMWNSENPMKQYDVMQKLCANNNDIIDSAKTLSILKLPENVERFIKRYDKYPYFFQYAKKKHELQCKSISNSVMDRICKNIENIGNRKFNYNKGFGIFKVKTLVFNQNNIQVNKDVITKYLELEKETANRIDEYAKEFTNKDEEDMKKTDFKGMFYNDARKQFQVWAEENNINILDIIDSIIKYTYKTNDLKMSFLWNVFGQQIINNMNININKPLDNGYFMCIECGKRIKRITNNQKMCRKCAKGKSHKNVKGDSEKVS